MAKTSHTASALQFLSAPGSFAPGVVCVVFGEEAYLKQEVLAKFQRQILGDDQDEFGVATFVGSETEWKDVVDALSTVSLFGSGQRVAIIREASGKESKRKVEEQADDEREPDKTGGSGFIPRYREQLEQWVERPAVGSVLILDAASWPGNTRLAKAVAAKGLAIDCRVPEKGTERTTFINQAKKWLVMRTRDAHGATLDPAAAELLFELLPLSMGVLDQEVAKLALYVPDAGKIDQDLVRQHVGDWRTRTTWDMIDAMVEGRAAEALRQLHLLMQAGEAPIALFGQIGYTLRNFAAAASFITQAEARGQRPSIRAALEEAGFLKFRLGPAEQQLKQIGRERACSLNDWLMEIDLALKGHNSSGPGARLELERLSVRLSSAANAQRTSAATT